MLLQTCYKLALANHVEYEADDGYGHKHTCKHVRRALNVYGTPESFGLATPIELSDMLDRVSLEAALWSLRAVYPEQIGTARHIARSLAMDACLEGASIYPDHKLYEQAYSVALEHLEGRATLRDLRPFRARVFNTIDGNGQMGNYGLVTLVMLSETPERYALEVLKGGIRAGLPDGYTKGAFDVQSADFKSYIGSTFRELLREEEPRGMGAGPGFITEPTNRGRPVTNRRKLLVRYNGNRGGNGLSESDNDTLKQSLINWGI